MARMDTTSAEARAPQPRALIVTVYGLYAREVGGWLSVATLVRLLAGIGVDEPAVRSSISRLKRRGLLTAARVDGQAGYGLSEDGRQALDAGDRRIFGHPAAERTDGWLLVVFSVPEAERQKRHMLRSRLTWLGFGTVASGVWVAPLHREAETRSVLERHGLTAYVDLFRADFLAFGDVSDQVHSWWDLDELRAGYDTFLDEFRPVLARVRRGNGLTPEAAFADHTRALTAWRRLPFLDPGLAADVLPSGWPGGRAAQLFDELHERLAGPAHEHVDAVRGRESRQNGTTFVG